MNSSQVFTGCKEMPISRKEPLPEYRMELEIGGVFQEEKDG